uniref:NADH-ubiquinone oxidoreductase chain 6 n=1 Tax=Salminus brasiliensis TaxID=930266 RepID=A0A1X9WD47_SALBR|nr:NADH dehydrogenase subunit 6 [Salminus brasiliensis]
MKFLSGLCMWGLIIGMTGVASNPAPFFAALGLVVVSGAGCGMLIQHGSSFLSLILFLIYLGGMLVVFAYSVALASEPYPEGWGDRPVVVFIVGYLMVVVMAWWWIWCERCDIRLETTQDLVVGESASGVSWMYYEGAGMLFVAGVALLFTLFVVLEVTRGNCRGSIRKV